MSISTTYTSISRLMIVGAAMVLAIGSAKAQQPDSSFAVGAIKSPMMAFTIDGVPQKTITLTRGKTYAFNLDTTIAQGNHVFFIATVPGGGGGVLSNYTYNVTPSGGSQSGAVIIAVDDNTRDTLYYECSVHSGMGGMILVVNAPSAVPENPAVANNALTFAAPNPCNDQSHLTLTVAEHQHVRVALFDTRGNEAALLADGTYNAGENVAITVNASPLASGTYFIRATGEKFTAERVITVAK